MATNMKRKETFQYFIMATVVLCFFAVVVLLCLIAVPATNKEALLLIIGALIGSYLTTINYLVGSSLSSAKKDETIASIKTPDPLPTTVLIEPIKPEPTETTL